MTLPGIQNMVSIFTCTLVCGIVPVLQFRRIKEEDDNVKLLAAYTAVHNIIILLVVVLFGKGNSRYMLTSIFPLVVLSARYIYVYWFSRKNYKATFWRSVFVFATLVECLCVISIGRNWRAAVAEKREFSNVILEHNLNKGYATYWNAYTNEVYSNLQVRFGGLQIDDGAVKSFDWLVDGDVFEPQDGINTFIALTYEEIQTVPDIAVQFGNLIDEFDVGELHVFVYDYDIAEKLIR